MLLILNLNKFLFGFSICVSQTIASFLNKTCFTKTGVYLLALSLVYACSPSFSKKEIENTIVSGVHKDQGPEDRYSIPYEPITYNQRIKAPLPGLAKDYKIIDWDGDGLLDILALIRRGGGLIFYRNTGTKKQPLYKPLQENEVLISDADFGPYFEVIDIDGNGVKELISYSYEELSGQRKQCVFFIYRSDDDGKIIKDSKQKINISNSFEIENPEANSW